MRKFTEIQAELQLIPFGQSPSGNLHCMVGAAPGPRLLVRHFDREIPPALIGALESLRAAAVEFIGRDEELAQLVMIDSPVEIGSDFIARRHRMGDSLAHFADDEDPPEPPPELAIVQERFGRLRASATSPEDLLVATILARSLLEPTSKTMYVYAEERFVITELKVTRSELELRDSPLQETS